MTKDEEQLIANIMHRMHVNEQARLDAALASARADAVARAEADRVRIEGLAKELRLERETCAETADLLNRESEKVRGLSVQAQDQRSEIERLRAEIDFLKIRDREYEKALDLCEKEEQTPAECIGSLNARIDRLQDEARSDARVREDLHRINVELQAEVAALQERLRASITRGDFAQMEVAALKSQTPKHPVKVGTWVRRSKLPGDQSPVGIVKQVTEIRCYGRSYGFADGDFWSVDKCEPCTHQHPAQDGQWVRRTVASGTEPVGTMIQVQRSRTLHSEYVTRGGWVVPWAHCEPCDPPSHDTEAGKAAAVASLETEPVTEEIKVGDIIEVVSATHKLYTAPEDIGRRGMVTVTDGMRISVGEVPGHKLPISGIVGKCDVRKVTT